MLLLLLLQAFEKPMKAERDAAAARHALAIKRLQAEKHLYVTDVSTLPTPEPQTLRTNLCCGCALPPGLIVVWAHHHGAMSLYLDGCCNLVDVHTSGTPTAVLTKLVRMG